MRIFIPQEYLGIVRDLDLRGWVNEKNWPRERYFRIVDHCRRALRELGDDSGDDPCAIARLLTDVLGKDTQYQDHLHDELNINLGNGEELFAKCRAGAWAIIQRYSREVDNKTWDTDLSDDDPQDGS